MANGIPAPSSLHATQPIPNSTEQDELVEGTGKGNGKADKDMDAAIDDMLEPFIRKPGPRICVETPSFDVCFVPQPGTGVTIRPNRPLFQGIVGRELIKPTVPQAGSSGHEALKSK